MSKAQLGSALSITVALILSLASDRVIAAGPSGRMPNPDFTKGDTIPRAAVHDWILGATGARGWMFSDKLVTSDARQIAITKVDADSPADGILEVGDAIVGVGGKRFSYDPRTEFGKAITAAESDEGAGSLSLLRWRAGQTSTVSVKIPVLGTYSETAPYDCPKSKRILEQGCQALAKHIADPSYRQNAITRSLNALALLASGNPEYLPLVKREAQWASGYSADGFQTWYYGYVMTLLAEYVMVTDDTSVMPGLRRLALEAANGQSVVGSWGHRFAQPDGRLGGYGMMNSPGVPLTTSLVLAREAGVTDPAIDTAIKRSVRLLRFYIGKGAVPYGDHHPWTQTHEDNGKCGMAAVLFNQLGEAKGAEFFSRMSVASHGAERDTGHTGNFFNILWSLPGVAQSGPHATGAWMQEFGSWYFDLARGWDGRFRHQGPPGLKNDKYANWDCTGAYLLSYAMPLRKLRLTGREQGVAPQLEPDAARALVADGRGWSNKDRNSYYDGLSNEKLLDRLGSWSPVVRKRAAMTLTRRKADVMPALMELLGSANTESQYGACQTLTLMKSAAAPAILALTRALESEDLWLRIKAAETLASIGQPAISTVPKLLEMLAREPSEGDPRGMEQRYLCFAIFGQMLKRSLDGVDRNLLRKAVAAGLHNEDGRARGSIGNVYKHLTYSEVKPLLPAIHEAVAKPAPSGVMFASEIRLAGLDVLASHRIKEGIPLCIDVMEIDKWGKRDRIRKCLTTLRKYGSAAKPVLPQLRQIAKDLLAHREARALKPQIDQLQAIVAEIENATETTELRSLR